MGPLPFFIKICEGILHPYQGLDGPEATRIASGWTPVPVSWEVPGGEDECSEDRQDEIMF